MKILKLIDNIDELLCSAIEERFNHRIVGKLSTRICSIRIKHIFAGFCCTFLVIILPNPIIEKVLNY